MTVCLFSGTDSLICRWVRWVLFILWFCSKTLLSSCWFCFLIPGLLRVWFEGLKRVVNACVICCRGLVCESICVDGWFIHHTSKNILNLPRHVLSFRDSLISVSILLDWIQTYWLLVRRSKFRCVLTRFGVSTLRLNGWFWLESALKACCFWLGADGSWITSVLEDDSYAWRNPHQFIWCWTV